MKIRVLGCSGAEFPGHRPPSILLNSKILFDAGSLTNMLSLKDQLRIRYIFITHTHLDHIMGIPFLADNLIFGKKRHTVKIISIPPVIRAIRRNILDGSIWPDFTVLPDTHEGILDLTELKPGHSIETDGGYTVVPYEVNHSVPATGYLVEDKEKRRFFYAGDTGPSDILWEKMRDRQIHCLIIEVSFPNGMEQIALETGHLTPRLLNKELLKMGPQPEKIFITHVKPQFFKTIRKEVERMHISSLKFLEGGKTITV